MRPYQQQAIEEIANEFRRGNKRVLLKMPTGGGKTHIFSDIMIRTAAKGNTCIMAVRGVKLIHQASARLAHEGVPHGVRQANHWRKDYSQKIQICSIDTLFARNDFPPASLLVLDECHLFTSERSVEFVNHYAEQGSFILGVTATPYTKEPLTHIGNSVVCPITMQELIDQGYLVSPRYFAPDMPNLNGVHVRNGDYIIEELEERMDVLTGDIVAHWRQLAEGRPTITFAVSVKHSKAIVEQYNASGIRAEHVDGNTPDSIREEIISRLKNGETKVIVNVGVFCTGVDIPEASCIQMARPTKSYSLYIQQSGRGTRTYPGKKDFIILDHAGNVLRHGFITDEPEIDLNGQPKKEKNGPQPKVCEKCFAIYTGRVCHVCGKEAPPVDIKQMEIEAGTLKELVGYPDGLKISLFIKRTKEIEKKRGYKRGYTYYKVKENFGDQAAEQAFGKEKKYDPTQPWFLR